MWRVSRRSRWWRADGAPCRHGLGEVAEWHVCLRVEIWNKVIVAAVIAVIVVVDVIVRCVVGVMQRCREWVPAEVWAGQKRREMVN